MNIVTYDSVNENDLMPIIYEGILDLQNQGFENNGPLVAWDQSAIVAFANPDQMAGIMVYRAQKQLNHIFVYLSYVKPEFRCMGCFRSLWNQMTLIAQSEKVRKIISVTHPDNTVMHAVNERLGRKAIGITYEYDMKKPPSDDTQRPPNYDLRSIKSPDDWPF